MKILDRYISRRFVQFFLFSIVAFVGVFLIVDLVENLDHFIDRGAKAVYVVLYYVYYLPYIIVLVMPIGTLLATAFLGGYLVKNRELVAMRSAGISSTKIVILLIIWGFLISIAAFLGGEFLIPHSNSLRDELKRVKIDKRKGSRGRLKNDLFYITEDGTFFYFRTLDSKRGTGRDIIIQKYSDGKLVLRMDAKKIKWLKNGNWRLFDVIVRKFVDEKVNVENFPQYDLKLSETPTDFARKSPKPEEMGFFELKKFIDKVERSGIIPKREKTDLWMKFAYPLVNLVVIMLGISLSFRVRVGSYLYGFGQSFFVAFIYLGVLRAGQAFGYNGTLPPALAAFSGDIIFVIIGMFLLTRIEKV